MCPARQIFGLALPHEKKTYLTLPCRMVILVSITYCRSEIGSILDLLERFLKSKVHSLLLRGHDGTTNVLLIVSTARYVIIMCAFPTRQRRRGSPMSQSVASPLQSIPVFPSRLLFVRTNLTRLPPHTHSLQ